MTSTERPILFRPGLVHAILYGKKTVTRRPLRPQPPPTVDHGAGPVPTDWHAPFMQSRFPRVATLTNGFGLSCVQWHSDPCPYGGPGEVLWVRETWADVGTHYVYRADFLDLDPSGEAFKEMFRTKASIHMPRRACRLRLRVVDVRLERLHAIDGSDAIREGFSSDYIGGPRAGFEATWEEIHGQGSWDANPWVWRIEFEVLP